MKTYGGLFGDSPFAPIYEHYLKIETGARKLPAYLLDFSRGDLAAIDAMASEIKRLEEEADTIKDETRRRLTTSIFAAIERNDIIQYLSTQDDIADHYTRIVSILSIRRTPLPANLMPLLIELCDSCLAVVYKLGEVLKSIISKSPTDNTYEIVQLLPALEHDANEKEEQFLKRLFAEEGLLDAISLAILLRVAEDLMGMAKRARNSSDILTRLLK
jgi:uncharacterized protein